MHRAGFYICLILPSCSQVWMAENINFETSESYCYDNDVKNCEKFGRLYTRKAAQEACPKGWILPKIYDFQRLVDYSGVYSGRVQNATKRLMVKEFCDKYGCGTEEFGFSAIPTGSYVKGKFVADTSRENSCYGDFKCWLDGWIGEEKAAIGQINWMTAGEGLSEKNNGFPVRCLRSATMTDRRDGKKYKAVKIKGQVWMAENLNYKTSRSHCAGDIDIGCNRFGRYYDWDEAMEACPEGWRLLTARDWESLFDAMGKSVYAMQGVTTFSLKSTDAYNFSVIPAGLYNFESDKVESAGGEFAGFWTATESADGSVFFWGVGPDRAGLQDGVPKRNAIALSVRCVKD